MTSWNDKKKITSEFDQLFSKFRDSILVVSYRSDGIPSIETLIQLLKRYKLYVTEIDRRNYKYVLSTNNSEEVLLIAQ